MAKARRASKLQAKWKSTSRRTRLALVSFFVIGALLSGIVKFFEVPEPTLSFLTPQGYAAPSPIVKKSLEQELEERIALMEDNSPAPADVKKDETSVPSFVTKLKNETKKFFAKAKIKKSKKGRLAKAPKKKENKFLTRVKKALSFSR